MDIEGVAAAVTGGASGLGGAANPMPNGEAIRLDGAVRMGPT